MNQIKNQEAINALLEGIDYLIEQKIENSSFARIKNGKVLQALGDNIYSVSIENKNYNIPSIGAHTINIGDVVKVVIAQNDYSNMFII